MGEGGRIKPSHCREDPDMLASEQREAPDWDNDSPIRHAFCLLKLYLEQTWESPCVLAQKIIWVLLSFRQRPGLIPRGGRRSKKWASDRGFPTLGGHNPSRTEGTRLGMTWGTKLECGCGLSSTLFYRKSSSLFQLPLWHFPLDVPEERTFPAKVQITNAFGFVGHTAVQLCLVAWK